MALVEVIYEGDIVKMCEICSSRENVLVLRKPIKLESGEKRENRSELFRIERKPYKIFSYKKNNVASELILNFHWELVRVRRERNLTRKKVAEAIGETEESIKMVENGILPRDDFVFINKLQKYLGINIRKDKSDFDASARAAVETKAVEGLDYLREKENKLQVQEDKHIFSGDEIELEEN